MLRGEKKTREEYQSTFIRKPTDYETHPRFQHNDSTKFEFSGEFRQQKAVNLVSDSLKFNIASSDSEDNQSSLTPRELSEDISVLINS